MAELPDALRQAEKALHEGRIQDARLMVVEYIRRIPNSEQAWWLLSFAVLEDRQQIDCLQRVLLLNPNNLQARERLTRIKRSDSQPRLQTTVNPFMAAAGEGEPEPKAEAAGPRSGPDATPPQQVPSKSGSFIPDSMPSEPAPQEEVNFPIYTARPAEPVAGAESVPQPEAALASPPIKRNRKTRGGLILAILLVFLVAASAIGYTLLQKKLGKPSQNVQQTLEMAQVLTNLPRPTLPPTWTPTSTRTFTPTASPTGTSTLTPTLQYTLTRTPPPANGLISVVGFFAPDFSLKNAVTGQETTLGQFTGRPVLIFFWATWSVLCQEELPWIEKLYNLYKGEGLVLLGINSNEEAKTVTSFYNANGLTFPTLLDPDSTVAALYQPIGVPRHIFIRTNGKIAYIGNGLMSYDSMEFQIKNILREYSTPTP